LYRGASIRCIKDEFNSSLTKVNDSINQFSFSNRFWTTITNNDKVVSFHSKQIKETELAQSAIDAFKTQIINFDENNTYISPVSKNKKYFSLLLENREMYFFNLVTMNAHKINVDMARYGPSSWSSWSPNQDYVLYNHFHEYGSTMYVYDITNNQLEQAIFHNPKLTQNDLGFISPNEVIQFEITDINWINDIGFEII